MQLGLVGFATEVLRDLAMDPRQKLGEVSDGEPCGEPSFWVTFRAQEPREAVRAVVDFKVGRSGVITIATAEQPCPRLLLKTLLLTF